MAQPPRPPTASCAALRRSRAMVHFLFSNVAMNPPIPLTAARCATALVLAACAASATVTHTENADADPSSALMDGGRAETSPTATPDGDRTPDARNDGAGECPPTPPQAGTPCNSNRLTCSGYAGCTPSCSCSNGYWSCTSPTYLASCTEEGLRCERQCDSFECGQCECVGAAWRPVNDCCVPACNDGGDG
jgi:hypothetical protein